MSSRQLQETLPGSTQPRVDPFLLQSNLLTSTYSGTSLGKRQLGQASGKMQFKEKRTKIPAWPSPKWQKVRNNGCFSYQDQTGSLNSNICRQRDRISFTFYIINRWHEEPASLTCIRAASMAVFSETIRLRHLPCEELAMDLPSRTSPVYGAGTSAQPPKGLCDGCQLSETG